MAEYFDELETRSQDEREADLFKRLPIALNHAVEKSSGWAHFLDGVDTTAVT